MSYNPLFKIKDWKMRSGSNVINIEELANGMCEDISQVIPDPKGDTTHYYRKKSIKETITESLLEIQRTRPELLGSEDFSNQLVAECVVNILDELEKGYMRIKIAIKNAVKNVVSSFRLPLELDNSSTTGSTSASFGSVEAVSTSSSVQSVLNAVSRVTNRSAALSFHGVAKAAVAEAIAARNTDKLSERIDLADLYGFKHDERMYTRVLAYNAIKSLANMRSNKRTAGTLSSLAYDDTNSVDNGNLKKIRRTTGSNVARELNRGTSSEEDSSISCGF